MWGFQEKSSPKRFLSDLYFLTNEEIDKSNLNNCHLQQWLLRACSLVICDLRSQTKDSFLVWPRLLESIVSAVESAESVESAVISRLISKCLWSEWNWQRGVKELASTFPSCHSWKFVKENPDRKKKFSEVCISTYCV